MGISTQPSRDATTNHSGGTPPRCTRWSIRSALLHHPEVLEYQVHQTPTGITLHVVATDQLDTAATGCQRAGRAALNQAGLHNATVELSRVNSIERKTATGKVRRFIPLDSVLTTCPE